jgi:hypothetical protein
LPYIYVILKVCDFEKKFMAPLLANFEDHINIPSCAAKLKRVFYFRKMPLDRRNPQVTIGTSLVPLHDLGNDEVEWVVGTPR